MDIDREAFKYVFLRRSGEPRNYDKSDVIGFDDEKFVRHYTEADLAGLRAEASAFKKTQRKFAIGVVAVVGSGVNLLNPPENITEFAVNFLPAVVVQTASYLSFKNGVNLMRDRHTE